MRLNTSRTRRAYWTARASRVLLPLDGEEGEEKGSWKSALSWVEIESEREAGLEGSLSIACRNVLEGMEGVDEESEDGTTSMVYSVRNDQIIRRELRRTQGELQ